MATKDRLESLILAEDNTIGINEVRAFQDPYAGPFTLIYDDVAKDNATESFIKLFRNLHRFSKLTELFVTVNTTDPAYTLEILTEKCPNLTTLRIDFNDRASYYHSFIHAPEVGHSMDISSCTPRPNIKVLQGFNVKFHNSRFLSYIMRKYPGLQSLYLRTRDFDFTQSLELDIVDQFLIYLSNIEKVSLHDVCMKMDGFLDSIEKYWTKSPNSAPKMIKFKYIEKHWETVKLDILKDEVKGTSYTYIGYYSYAHNFFEHNKILEKFGQQFETIDFVAPSPLYFYRKETEEYMYSGKYIDHILCHCHNLKNLYLSSCKITKIDLSNFQALNKNLKIGTLRLTQFIAFNDDVLRNLFTVFDSIKYLRLIKNTYRDDRAEETNLDMTNTDIDSLVFEFKYESEEPVYLKIFTASSGEYSYYKYDFFNMEDRVFKACSQAERDIGATILVGSRRHILPCHRLNIYCRSLNYLQVANDDNTASVSFK